jgi:hypothetical protein
MAPRWKWLLGIGFVLLALVTSFSAGRNSARPSSSRESASSKQPHSQAVERPSPPPPSPDLGIRLRDDLALRQELRQLLQEELRSARAEAERNSRAEAAAASESDASEKPAMDAAGLAAYDRGQALVRDALSSRLWTPKQAEQMRAILPRLPQERGRELLGQLFSAMSRGEVKSDGPPI